MEAKEREWGSMEKFNPGWLQFRQDLSDCPRCDGDHPDLLYKRLRQPTKTKINEGWIYLTHWATCPSTGEPVRAMIRRLKSRRQAVPITTGTSGGSNVISIFDYAA